MSVLTVQRRADDLLSVCAVCHTHGEIVRCPRCRKPICEFDVKEHSQLHADTSHRRFNLGDIITFHSPDGLQTHLGRVTTRLTGQGYRVVCDGLAQTVWEMFVEPKQAA